MTAVQARQCLERVLASPQFSNAARVQEFLRFVVEETLEGRGGEIKEAVLAVEVFGRKGDFDSRSDSVVRVQASHLRKRLREYYRNAGLSDPVVIEIPLGSYAPVLRPAAQTPSAADGKRARPWLKPTAALAILASIVVLWVYSRLGPAGPASIAVLPFTNLDGASGNDVLTDGLAEDVMAALARSPGLQVVARTSAFQFRGKNVRAQSIGRDLGARALVEGTVRGTRDHVKITAQLVNVRDGFDLWSETWEGPASEVPIFEEQIVRGVRKGLKLEPSGERLRTPAAAAIHLPAPGAQESYWMGRSLLSKPPDAEPASIPLLEQAVQADPQYAPAHAALTTAYVTALYHGFLFPREEPLKKARLEGARALQLDPTSSEALASLALLSFAFDHDWPAAQRGFERALESNPSDARAHLEFAMGLVTRARFSEALAHLEQARALDPLSFAATNYLSLALYHAGRYTDSIAAARRTLSVDPNYTSAHVAIGRGLALSGNYAGAAAELELAMQKYGRGPWLLGRMGYVLAHAGRTSEALAAVKEIESQQGPAIQTAFVWAGLGDRQRALDALDRAFQQGNIDLNFMAVEPMLGTLHAEPRFLALKSRMGL